LGLIELNRGRGTALALKLGMQIPTWLKHPRLIFGFNVLKEAGKGFSKHHAPRMGAALAFYTLLSLSPMLLIVLALVGAFFGDEAAHGALTAQIKGLVGGEGARAIEAMVSNANRPSQGIVASIIGVIVLVFGATGVFVELKGALDAVWETPDLPSGGFGIRALARERLLAFAAIAGLAFLLLVSLVFTAMLTAIGDRFLGSFGQSVGPFIVNLVLSFLLTTAMFAMIFKLLPAARPPWRQVWGGAMVTTLLFLIGKALIGLYLGQAAVGSAYGAAGSLVVLLVWVYYSTQILLFGSEITRAGPIVRTRTPAAVTPAPK